ncbi:right-handed parallel beta-helix repeat-containing protein [Methanosphaera cuniculi]|uniref:right-handed parallel beta-helix repeat-containing protein n=1 Tax=Methanosphaera cuniculi TaxID=1077256 RepID=UPI0026DB4813|nr:right-handed parallel beta-helix repeat-containing protein [Methanosphaera cuniculi]
MFNKKLNLVLVMTLIVFLVGVTAVSAADADNTQSIQTDNQLQQHTNTQQTIEKTTTQTQNDETQTTKTNKKVETTSKNTVQNTKTINENKENTKTVKKAENTSVTVNSGNYFSYFNSRGRMLSKIGANTTVILTGEFENRNFEVSKPGVYVTGENVLIKNGQVKIAEEAIGATVTNLKIQISGTDYNYAISNQALNVTISNNEIKLQKVDGEAIGIKNIENNAKILNNNVTVEGPDEAIDWSGMSDKSGEVNTAAVKTLGGENVVVTGNILNVSKIEGAISNEYGTIDAIELKGKNATVKNNTIYLYAGRFGYAITATALQNSTITNNKIYGEGERYVDGIQVADGVSNVVIANNEITLNCNNSTIYKDDNEAMAFGIITSSMGGAGSENINIYNNTININATIGYGMEIYRTSYANITDNKLKLNGVYSSGISLAHSPNCLIIDNKVNTTGNSRIYTNQVVEEIIPANKGIGIQQESANTIVRGNVVNSTDEGNNAYALFINRTNDVLIENNTFDTNTQHGVDSMGYQNSTNITNRSTITGMTGKKTAQITVTLPANMTVGDKINLTAKVVDSTTKQAITSGKVVFKINGATVKVGNISTIKLNNKGIVQLEYDLIQLSSKTYKITAVFGGNSYYNRADSEAITFIPKKVDVKIPSIKTFNNVYTGDKILINETLFDKNNRQLIGSNKVAIKYNGKTIQKLTIKDGKLSTSVQIPLTASSGKNKLEIVVGETGRYSTTRIYVDVNTIKQAPVFTITKASAYPGTPVRFNVTIKTNVTNSNVLNGKVGYKINGITQYDMNDYGDKLNKTLTISNGTVSFNFVIPFDFASKSYKVTITFSGNSYVEAGRYTSDALTLLF